jgi:hypothetical protein
MEGSPPRVVIAEDSALIREDVVAGPRKVVARGAIGEERARLWAQMSRGRFGPLDRWAALRSRETAVVVFEPRG